MNTAIPDNLLSALVAQYNAERYNAAVYKSLQAAFEEVNWGGFAKWCGKSAQEETAHSDRFFNYLAKRQAVISVGELAKPPEFNGEDVIVNFETALALEVNNTARITALARLALDVNDFMTLEELQWFLHEQADSEAEIVQIVSDLGHADDYWLIDQKLGGQ
jgi:ferritin